MVEPARIETCVLEGCRPGPHLLVTGGVHGDEFEPMQAIRQLMQTVDAKSLTGRLSLVPVVNESAWLEQRRCGADGLDLARTCPGRADGSVTERTAYALCQQIRKADYYIDLHTGGTRLCVSPMTGYMLHSDPEVLAIQRSMAAAFNLPIVWGTSAELDGRSLSAARDAGIPAIYAEYLGGGRCSEDGVAAYVTGVLNVMAALGMVNRPPPRACVVHHVEDRRPRSGHMQIQNPAPEEGFFSPHVELGQLVSAGDSLGRITDKLGERTHEIRATEAGVVLTLRTFPRVDKGDGLAVIVSK